MMNRRHFLSVVVPAVAVAGCSRAEPVSRDRRQDPATDGSRDAVRSSSARPEKLKLTGFKAPVLCLVGWNAARERGFFAAEGLDVELLPLAPAETPAHHPAGSFLTGPMGVVRGDLVALEYQNLADLALGNGDYYVVAGEH